MKLWFITLTVIVMSGCQPREHLVLPEGDAESGKRVFLEYRCNDCHSVADVDASGVEVQFEQFGRPAEGTVLVKLGGQTSRTRTQAQLVASIVNPSHEISTAWSRHNVTEQSPMRTYNDAMSVQNLIDLVTFLEAAYDITGARTLTRPLPDEKLPDEKLPDEKLPDEIEEP